jgi:hypothetical protein
MNSSSGTLGRGDLYSVLPKLSREVIMDQGTAICQTESSHADLSAYKKAVNIKYSIETKFIQMFVHAAPALTNATEMQGNGKVIYSQRKGMCTYNHSPCSHVSL